MQQCVQVFLQFLSSNHGPAAAFVLHAEFYAEHPTELQGIHVDHILNRAGPLLAPLLLLFLVCCHLFLKR